MGTCASAPETRFPEAHYNCSSKLEESCHKNVDASSKLAGRHSIRLRSEDLDRSARDGAAFLLRPSMQCQGLHSHNPSTHRKRSSLAADTSVHQGHLSVSTSGDQLRKQRASCSASADSNAHKAPLGSLAIYSQAPLSAGSVGAADLNPSSSGKLRHRKLQDVEAKGKHGSVRESMPMSDESCYRSGQDGDGSSQSAFGTGNGSFPCSASLAKSGSRQGSPGLDNVNFFVSPLAVDGVRGGYHSQPPDAHVPPGPSLQPEHMLGRNDSESIMLIGELSDSKSEGFVDEDVQNPNKPDSGEHHQSSLANMFDKEVATLTGCELAGAIRTDGGAPPNRATSNKVSPRRSASQQLPPGPITYRHSISGDMKGQGPGSEHDGMSMPVCSPLSVAPSAPSARSLQKSLCSSSKTHRPSRFSTPSPGSHSGPQVLQLDPGEQDMWGSGQEQLDKQDQEAMRMALELSAFLSSPDAVPKPDEHPGCGLGDLPRVVHSRDDDEADHTMRGSPFKASQVQEPDLLDPSSTFPDSDVHSPSPTSPTRLQRQSSWLNRPAINLRNLAKAGSINSQGSSQTSPKPVHGCGPTLSPKSSGDGLTNGLHSLRSLGSHLFRSKPTNEPVPMRQELHSPRLQARMSTSQQHSDTLLLLSQTCGKPGSCGVLDHDTASDTGMAVGGPPGRDPASSNAVGVPGCAQNFNRRSVSRDMPASLNQWVAGSSKTGSSPAGSTSRNARQQPPSPQQFPSASPKGPCQASGSTLGGASCSSPQEMSRDVDEITALSYFCHKGSMTNQRQGSLVGGSTRNPHTGPHSQSASCHGGLAFYSSSAHPVHERPTSGSIHGGTAFAPKAFSFSPAPSGSVHGGTAAPMFRKAPSVSPASSANLSQATRLGPSSSPSTLPPPTSDSSNDDTARQSHSMAQVNQPKPKVTFASQHGGTLYKDYTDKAELMAMPKAVSGSHAMSAAEMHCATSPVALEGGHTERALSFPNQICPFIAPNSPSHLNQFLPKWLDRSQHGGAPR